MERKYFIVSHKAGSGFKPHFGDLQSRFNYWLRAMCKKPQQWMHFLLAKLQWNTCTNIYFSGLLLVERNRKHLKVI